MSIRNKQVSETILSYWTMFWIWNSVSFINHEQNISPLCFSRCRFYFSFEKSSNTTQQYCLYPQIKIQILWYNILLWNNSILSYQDFSLKLIFSVSRTQFIICWFQLLYVIHLTLFNRRDFRVPYQGLWLNAVREIALGHENFGKKVSLRFSTTTTTQTLRRCTSLSSREKM